MNKGYGKHAICLLCEHYKIAHSGCCGCENFVERDLILSTLEMLIREDGEKHEPRHRCILVSKSMMELLARHIRTLTIQVLEKK